MIFNRNHNLKYEIIPFEANNLLSIIIVKLSIIIHHTPWRKLGGRSKICILFWK